MIFLNDYEEKKFKTREELQDYLDFRKENDIWCQPAVNETSVIGLGIGGSEESTELDTIPDDVLKSAYENNRLIYCFPYNFAPTVYPIRYTAFPDICSRAGLKGRTIESFTARNNISVLDPVLKACFLSTGLSLNANECNILIRDEKVACCKSHEYKIFHEYELIDLAEKEFLSTWSNFSFDYSTVSHEYLTVSYLLNATDMEESFCYKLDAMGIGTEKISAGISISTSDVGNSSVSISPFYIINGVKTMLGTSMKVRHDKGNTLDDVKNCLSSTAMVFREAEDEIERLGNNDLLYPIDCFLNILEDLNLPKTYADDVILNLETLTDPTALDVYIALNDLVERHCKMTEASIKTTIDMSEAVAKLLKSDFSKYDQVYDQV